MVIPKRMTAEMEGPFCVFLIGMRINRPLKFHKWLPVLLAMPRMLEELRRQPELGFMGGHVWLGRTMVLLQVPGDPLALSLGMRSGLISPICRPGRDFAGMLVAVAM